jgi:hypothetical protein
MQLTSLESGENLLRGDLIFWDGHVAMMVDSDTMIHASACAEWSMKVWCRQHCASKRGATVTLQPDGFFGRFRQSMARINLRSNTRNMAGIVCRAWDPYSVPITVLPLFHPRFRAFSMRWVFSRASKDQKKPQPL